MNLHITEAVESGEDLLVAIGVYPVQMQSKEEENIMILMENVVEEVDDTTNEGSTTESDDEGNNGVMDPEYLLFL